MPRFAPAAARHVLTCTIVGVTLTGAGCGALPHEQKRAQPGAVRGALERATGIDLHEAPPSPIFGTMGNVQATYFGGDERENLLVIVFNSPRATRQPLGRGFTVPPDTTLVRDRNVVVFYTSGKNRRAPGRKIRRAIKGL